MSAAIFRLKYLMWSARTSEGNLSREAASANFNVNTPQSLQLSCFGTSGMYSSHELVSHCSPNLFAASSLMYLFKLAMHCAHASEVKNTHFHETLQTKLYLGILSTH